MRGHDTPARTGASADVIILPVVRIERALEAPSCVKAKPIAKSLAKSLVKSTPGRKRRKRAAPALISPACGRG
jgi:hypothetical protein